MAIDLDKLSWVGRIEEALSNERFVLHAQPILELATGQIVQRELLIRMRHPEGSEEPGLVPPGYFLPVAEEFGLITEIDRWVIDQAAEMAATGLPVELNVSGRSIGDPRLVDYIRGALERTGANPQMLVFEITETTLIADDHSARAFVAKLHGLGCKIALDDFGTGYGGFTDLKQLPIDYLKIDIEFVSDLLYNPASRTVVQAIVKLAQGFGLKTVAEGVESGTTMEALASSASTTCRDTTRTPGGTRRDQRDDGGVTETRRERTSSAACRAISIKNRRSWISIRDRGPRAGEG